MAITSIFLNSNCTRQLSSSSFLVIQSIPKPACVHLSSTLIINSPFSKHFPYIIHVNSLKLFFSSLQIPTGAPTRKISCFIVLPYLGVSGFRFGQFHKWGYSYCWSLKRTFFNFHKGCECGKFVIYSFYLREVVL